MWVNTPGWARASWGGGGRALAEGGIRRNLQPLAAEGGGRVGESPQRPGLRGGQEAGDLGEADGVPPGEPATHLELGPPTPLGAAGE